MDRESGPSTVVSRLQVRRCAPHRSRLPDPAGAGVDEADGQWAASGPVKSRAAGHLDFRTALWGSGRGQPPETEDTVVVGIRADDDLAPTFERVGRMESVARGQPRL